MVNEELRTRGFTLRVHPEGYSPTTTGSKPVQLPKCRPERVIELLEEFRDRSTVELDIYKVAEELRHLIGEELAEERRRVQPEGSP